MFSTIVPIPWLQLLMKQKKGKLLKSQCSTLYPCCVPALGEFKGSYLSKTCPMQRYNSISMLAILSLEILLKYPTEKSFIKIDKVFISFFNS